MCGITGTIDAVAERGVVTRVSLLNDAQTHRGPDHSVIARVDGITWEILG
jgi:asparagine synthetase B (glutamine-hydrolysing)